MSIRDAILSKKRRFTDVPVTIDGKETIVRVKSISARNAIDYQEFAPTLAEAKIARGEIPKEGDENKINDDNFLLLCFSCFDPETEELIFKPEDAKALQDDVEWVGTVNLLMNAMLNLMGDKKDVGKPDEAGKPIPPA